MVSIEIGQVWEAMVCMKGFIRSIKNNSFMVDIEPGTKFVISSISSNFVIIQGFDGICYILIHRFYRDCNLVS